MKRSKFRITTTVIALIFMFSGLVLVLFPPISNSYGKAIASDISESFDTRVKNIQQIQKGKKTADTLSQEFSDDEGVNYKKIDVDALYRDSIAYNKRISNDQLNYLTSDLVFEKPALHLSNYGIYDGVYGYVEAPSIDLKVPIYLGVQNNHMSYGAVHLTHTSLPIGDKKSKSVLAGHTGYVGRIFFDNIQQLKKGDVIRVVNYFGTVQYRVTGYDIIKPNQADSLIITNDNAEIALVTCISNSEGDFDRYVVFGERKI